VESTGGRFIVELTTREGRVAERYETFAEAQRRIDHFPQKSLVGLAFIFEELADGSQRLLRQDGKPLQFHRESTEDVREAAGDPLPLTDDTSSVVGPDGKLRIVSMKPPEEDLDEPPLTIEDSD
jgi:hypothetical protein